MIRRRFLRSVRLQNLFLLESATYPNSTRGGTLSGLMLLAMATGLVHPASQEPARLRSPFFPNEPISTNKPILLFTPRANYKPANGAGSARLRRPDSPLRMKGARRFSVALPASGLWPFSSWIQLPLKSVPAKSSASSTIESSGGANLSCVHFPREFSYRSGPFRGVGLRPTTRRAPPASGVWPFSCAPKTVQEARVTGTHSPRSSNAGFQPFESSGGAILSGVAAGVRRIRHTCVHFPRGFSYRSGPFRGVGLRPTKGGLRPPREFGHFLCSQNRQAGRPALQERTAPDPVTRASSLPSRAPARLSKVQDGRISPALL